MKTSEAMFIAGGMLCQQMSMFVIGVLIGRTLGADDYGIFSLLRNGSIWLLPVMSLGLELAIQKHVAHEKRPGEFSSIYRVLRLSILTINFLTIAISYGLAITLSNNRQLIDALFFAFLAMPFMSDALLASGYLRALSRPVSISVFNDYLQSMVRTALVLISIWLGSSLIEILIINAIAAAVTTIALWAYQLRVDKIRGVIDANRKITKMAVAKARFIISESVWMALSVLTYGSLRVADLFVLSFFVAANQLGSYAALSAVAIFVRLYPLALSQPLGAQISRHFHNEDFGAIRRTFVGNIRQSITVATFVFAGIAAFGVDLNLVFGDTFTFDPVLCFLLPFSWFVSSVLTPTGLALSMTNNHRQETYALLIGSGFLLAMLAILIPLFGPLGAAISSTIAFCVINFVRLWLAQRVLKLWLLQYDMVWPILLSLVLAYTMSFFLHKYWEINLANIICFCGAYTALYFSIVFGYSRISNMRLRQI